MIGIIALSLSLLVILSGLYLLSKSKKDGLGNLYIFSSYSAIVLGGMLFAGTVIGGTMMMRYHHGGHCSSYMSSCKSGNSCTSMTSCNMDRGHCSMNKEQCGHSSSFHHKSSCGAGAPACGAHQMHGKHHGAMMHHKRFQQNDKADQDIEVEVEVMEGEE